MKLRKINISREEHHMPFLSRAGPEMSSFQSRRVNRTAKDGNENNPYGGKGREVQGHTPHVPETISQHRPFFPGLPFTQLEERLGMHLPTGELVYQ